MNAQQPIMKIDYTTLRDGDAFRAPLSDIDPVPWGNIRKERDPVAFNELRQSIKEAKGVTQGVTVRINPDDPTRLQLLAGYGRVEASNLEGFLDIPAVFKVADDKAAAAIMMQENLVRESLSIADEIIASQKFISFYNGDYEAAAAHLNWPVKRLRGRLVLNQCTEKVLEALRREEIAIGHAEILSAFVPALQEGTLEKIIAEKWTVEYLKERAGKAIRWLKNAIFDTAECASCIHNSDVQASLFDNTIGKSKCSNLTCFREKTDAELAERKKTLEEEHGVVLLAIEKPETDRNTVGEEIVGVEQFTGGCTGCVSNIVILKDGINSDAGQVIPNQCINSDCFRKMKTAHAKSLKEQKAEVKVTESKGKSGSTEKAKTPDKKAKKKDPSKEKVVTQATPAAVTENNKVLLRSLGANHFENNAHFMEALCVSSLIDHAGFAHDASTRFKNITEIEISSSFNKRVLELYSLPIDTLESIKKACFSGYLVESKNIHTDPRALVISALAGDENGSKVAIAGWKPTQDNLGAYLKPGLMALATTSGFKAYFDSVNGENAFEKVAKKSKTELIDAMLKTEFDWSEFAPDDLLNCLK